MQSVRVFDDNFVFITEIDDYEGLLWTRKWHKPGSFELHMNLNKLYADRLKKDYFLMVGDSAGRILYRELKQGEKGKGDEEVVVKGTTYSAVVGSRITIPPTGYAYDRVNSNIETIMKGYVTRNCVSPVDVKRVIPNLIVAADEGRGEKIVYQSRYKQLDEELEKLSVLSGIGWDIRFDWDIGQWVFDVFEGKVLTVNQSESSPVVFSIDFDNIKEQSFIESSVGHKNMAYVGGQGEGVERTVIEVGNESEGLGRLEMFVDARDIEDSGDLPNRGMQKLLEVSPIKTFETEILDGDPFRYKVDWDLGDVVTIRNRKWGITVDSRITEVTEIYDETGFKLKVVFGNKVPTLIDRIKYELDKPLVEKHV